MHGRGYLKLCEIRVNLPNHEYKHVIQLVSDEGDKLNHVRGRLKNQREPYHFDQGAISFCSETRPNMETGEYSLEVEVDTQGIPGEDVDFAQIVTMFKTILRLRSLEEQEQNPPRWDVSPAVAEASPAASPAKSDAPSSLGASASASSGVAASMGGSEGKMCKRLMRCRACEGCARRAAYGQSMALPK